MSTVPADLTRLMNNMRVKLPGAVDAAIQLELFNVLNTFFQTTKAWQEDVDVAVVANQDTYDVTPTDPGTVDGLIGVVNSDDIPVSATMPSLSTLLLGFMPSQVDTLTVTLSLTVVDPTDRNGYPQYPDWLMPKYYDVILDGMLGAMMTHKAKPYSDERLAILHTRKFRNGMSLARGSVRRGNTYNAQAWRFPRFGR